MKYQHLLQKVFHEPWLITEGAHVAIATLVESRVLGSAPIAEREGTDYCGEKVEVDQMDIRDGIAHIPIGGVVGIKLSGFEKGAGAVDLRDVRSELDQATEDPRVRGIILDIDSPGGMVTGTAELAARISAEEKPIFAFSDGDIASAAYWIAAACDQIYTTSSASIGSIGVYIPWLDNSEAYKQRGYSVKLITSGKYKGMGYPGTTLSKDQESLLKSNVMEIAEEFYSHVRATRGEVSDETMQGQMFRAKSALAENLIDGIVQSKDEVCRMIYHPAR